MDEKEQAKALNHQFKNEAWSKGTEKALDTLHKFNAAADAKDERQRQNDMDGMASNRLMIGFKPGWGYRPNPRAGKRCVISTAVRDGKKGTLEQNFYDGVLVDETFKPH